MSGIFGSPYQQAMKASIPHVISPVEAGISNRQMGFRTIVLKQNQEYQVNIPGDYFYVEYFDFNASGGLINPGTSIGVKDSNLNEFVVSRDHYGIRVPLPFAFISLTSASPGDTYIRIYVGFGRIQSDPERGNGLPNNVYYTNSTWSRPANTTPYTDGDIVGTFDNVGTKAIATPVPTPTFGKCIVTDVEIRTNNPTVANTSFTLLIMSGPIGQVLVDNAAYNFDYSQQNYQVIDITNFVTFGPSPAGAFFQITGLNSRALLNYSSAEGYGLGFRLIARAAYVPIASQQFTISIGTNQIV